MDAELVGRLANLVHEHDTVDPGEALLALQQCMCQSVCLSLSNLSVCLPHLSDVRVEAAVEHEVHAARRALIILEVTAPDQVIGDVALTLLTQLEVLVHCRLLVRLVQIL